MAKKLVRFSHVFCPDCNSIQTMTAAEAGPDETREFTGTDLICVSCRLVIATGFQPVGTSAPDEPDMDDGASVQSVADETFYRHHPRE